MTTDDLRAEVAALRQERDMALWILAEWCVDVDEGGAGWDYWDENYKNAMYRPGPLRELMDATIKEVRAQRGLMDAALAAQKG